MFNLVQFGKHSMLKLNYGEKVLSVDINETTCSSEKISELVTNGKIFLPNDMLK